MKAIQKNTSIICTAALLAACTFAPAALLAQSDPTAPAIPAIGPQQPTNPNTQMPGNPSSQDSSGAPGLTGQMMRDKLFIRTAVEGDLLEIELGKLAAQKATSADVKALGARMVTDHTALNQSFSTIADSMGYMLPKKMSKDGQAQYDKLKALPPADFDTQYIIFVATEHRKDQHAFREEFAATTDPALHDEIGKAAMVIHEHTQLAEKLAKDKNITLPPRPTRPTATGE